jgi:hypothetical protein
MSYPRRDWVEHYQRPAVSPNSPVVRCHKCDGRGLIPARAYDPIFDEMRPLPRPGLLCVWCGGKGTLRR